ncbi:hypothetical protein PR202_gb06537 [Eleusine coracana subsp. coracana]|uniref:Nuclear pore complex protein NUP205 n=1 Tax=Eleusine coracana subsp. coracana TaxID=191504 RepID=A0AAV5E9P4_ELECO|nr:hypothetical protein PR202_gb06537 [Eleusine coracana subsp. coracana]
MLLLTHRRHLLYHGTAPCSRTTQRLHERKVHILAHEVTIANQSCLQLCSYNLFFNGSSRIVGLVQLLLKADVAKAITEDYAACLEFRFDDSQVIDNTKDDVGLLILQLLYELCLDPLTCGPVMDLLSTKKYLFFSKRAWLLKMLALALHQSDISSSVYREACLGILYHTFGQYVENFRGANLFQSPDASIGISNRATNRNKVLDLLEVVQFRCPDTSMKYPQLISNLRVESKIEEILRNSAISELGGVYYYSERGDRLIDLDAFHEKLIQMSQELSLQLSESEKSELKESVHQLLKWAWRYNKNLEEQAAQLHMLTGWSQIVEVAVSRRMSLLEDCSELLFELLDASLSATTSPDCSVKMAYVLTNVALTCMAKLRDERFVCPAGADSDAVTCADIISAKQLPNAACNSLLFKLIMAMLRNESSEALRRRQYALLLSYFQYCRSILDSDVPPSVLRLLLLEEQEGDEDDLTLQKVLKEHNDLAHANFSIIRKEAQPIVDLVHILLLMGKLHHFVTKDAVHGSETGRAISFYVLDALISIDHEKYFLNQLQSRGILRSCLSDVTNYLSKGNSRAISSIVKERAGEIEKKRSLIAPVLRIVTSFTSLVESSDFLEVKNKIVREIVDFAKQHQSVFNSILRENMSGANLFTLERLNMVVSILSKVSYDHNSDQQQPTLQMVSDLLNSITIALERVAEEKYLLLNKVRDLNELSRKEVDEIIKVCMKQDCISPNDSIRKRRYIAMINLCCMAGNRDQLITLLLQIAECAITILLAHFNDEAYVKDLSSFSDELLPVLERLEHLKEDKVGRSLKLFHRSVTTLKEMTIRSMTL